LNTQTTSALDTFEQEILVIEPDQSAVNLIAAATPLSKQKIKQAMSKGAVWLSQAGAKPHRLRRSKRVLQPGDELTIHYDEQVLSTQPEPAKLIKDMGGYSVWVKPYGMFSQGSKWGDHCTIYRWAEQHLEPQRTATLVHRLDRAASGLMLLAHNKKTASTLSALFRDRQIDKRYQVIVHGEFPESIWPQVIENELDEKRAKSSIKRLSYAQPSNRSLLEISIETGRKHQIRRHLIGIGFPVVGDRLYGNSEDQEDLLLVAASLAFHCPLSNQDVRYQAPVTLQL
jgi:tRNA pseudouridine32 synthase/23S rRNA pseudouridine746 synthase